jgi:hypothetical protein
VLRQNLKEVILINSEQDGEKSRSKGKA